MKTSKIHNRRILATKTITYCWCGKNRFCMKSKRQKKRHKNISREHFSFTNSTRNFARNQTHDILIDQVNNSRLSLKKIRIFMCEQDYESKKLVITKFSLFLQSLNSNFRLSANRAILSKSIFHLQANSLRLITWFYVKGWSLVITIAFTFQHKYFITILYRTWSCCKS